MSDPQDDDIYLIWSNEHRGWWRAEMCGYAPGLNDAGHYSRTVALAICSNAIPTARHIGRISEIPVRLADMKLFLHGQTVPEVIFSGKE